MSEEYFEDDAESVVRLEPSPLLAPIRTDVIALNEDTDPDTLLLVLGGVKNYLAELKQLKALVEVVMIERIKLHGNIVVSPTVFYTVEKDKTTKPKDLKAATEALLTAAGGDVNLFIGALSSNALKPGQAKKMLTPEQFAECFVTTEKEVVKEGKSKPVEKLLRLDEKFFK